MVMLQEWTSQESKNKAEWAKKHSIVVMRSKSGKFIRRGRAPRRIKFLRSILEPRGVNRLASTIRWTWATWMILIKSWSSISKLSQTKQEEQHIGLYSDTFRISQLQAVTNGERRHSRWLRRNLCMMCQELTWMMFKWRWWTISSLLLRMAWVLTVSTPKCIKTTQKSQLSLSKRYSLLGLLATSQA